MQCGELITTNVRIASSKSTAAEAAAMMRDNNVGFLPVCDLSSGEILGTITDRDIAIRLVAGHMPPSTPATQLATPVTSFCHPDTTIERAHETMRRDRIAWLLCVDDNGRLAGVLSLADIAGRMPELAGDTLRDLSRREMELVHEGHA